MVAIKTLLPELRELVTELAEDLLARSIGDPKIDAGLREAFQQIEKGGRTAQAFEVWREDYLDQVAVAWVLACVFVRFMEDNHLIDESWLAGEGDRRKLAEDTHELFFRQHPHDTDREYFHHVFHEVGKIPAAKDLFVEGKTPLWAVAPSGDAAMSLLKFWREIDAESGHLKRSFQVESADTRFLGDLYQELSERAKKKFALLQTPVFVEEFILDRTLTPALAEFGLEKFRMIDPTCGSGHFLLGGFARLFDLWSKPDHTTGNVEKDAQKALDGVWGVDINPFAVAIARFRLIAAAVQACGIKRLKHAPGWKIHLTTGDSLLFGSKPSFGGERVGIAQQFNLFDIPDICAVEDRNALQKILGQGYHAVVGNPPYITARDKAQNDAYRALYSTCHRKYSLAVPFAQRFWELAMLDGESNSGCGYIGQITANSFMKREFGKKLIEEFFPKLDLTHIIDTSRMGHSLAGYGTPTVILFGRNRSPTSNLIRAVLGIKGEPSSTVEGLPGFVWQSILRQIDRADSQDEYTSTSDVPRIAFARHPWSIGGGGASDVTAQLEESCDTTLGEIADSVGYSAIIGDDDAFVMDDNRIWDRKAIKSGIKGFAVGDCLRDWSCLPLPSAIYPYDDNGEFRKVADAELHLWTLRTGLRNGLFYRQTKEERGLDWRQYAIVVKDKLFRPETLLFAFVATHNHFFFDHSGCVSNKTAPGVKLPLDLADDDHISLLGLLNSSTACFWMKQKFFDRGGGGIGGGLATENWERFYEYDGTKMKRFPVCDQRPVLLSRQLDAMARQIVGLQPASSVRAAIPKNDRLRENRKRAGVIRGQMIALQEELDWNCYLFYGLLSEEFRYSEDDLPELDLGQRAFEIVMARKMAANGGLETTWFERHDSMPISEIPSHWPAAYQELVERRIKVIETNNAIALIEKPEYKRRWNAEPWEEQEQRALKNWLLDRLETPKYRKGTNDNQELTTTAQMADVASADAEFLQVAALYRGRPDFDVAALMADLVEDEAVPFLPILRYKSSGLRKREVWERTWDLQRQQDARTDVGDIPVPPKYATADFLNTHFWRLRGKLDVPKERWISYAHCSTDSDATLVVGWAGWDHLEQATALVAYYDARKREGWDAKRLTPLLAGLDQLLPWIHQWHSEIDAEFGETAGQSYQTMLEHDAHELGLTLDDIRNWTPPEKTRKARTSRKKKSTAGVRDDA